MPIQYARSLTGRQRSSQANRQLGLTLAFIAGAVNAGGFLAVQQYTSHMTGAASTLADAVVLGQLDLALASLGALLSFVAGAATSTWMVSYARRMRLQSEYASPLLLEAALLLLFGLLGARLAHIHGLFVPATVMLLCFLMGLQNAVITKISRAEIRTTHITGIVTDIGIELGKLAYWNAATGVARRHHVVADRDRLRLLAALAGSFIFGGLLGAVGFKHLGYVTTVPLALLLVALASVPALDDLVHLRRRWRR